MLFRSGSGRYFTVREAARLQTFPDEYALRGAWSEAMRQLGNAVPVALAHAVGAGIAARLTAFRAKQTADVLANPIPGMPTGAPKA